MATEPLHKQLFAFPLRATSMIVPEPKMDTSMLKESNAPAAPAPVLPPTTNMGLPPPYSPSDDLYRRLEAATAAFERGDPSAREKIPGLLREVASAEPGPERRQMWSERATQWERGTDEDRSKSAKVINSGLVRLLASPLVITAHALGVAGKAIQGVGGLLTLPSQAVRRLQERADPERATRASISRSRSRCSS